MPSRRDTRVEIQPKAASPSKFIDFAVSLRAPSVKVRDEGLAGRERRLAAG